MLRLLSLPGLFVVSTAISAAAIVLLSIFFKSTLLKGIRNSRHGLRFKYRGLRSLLGGLCLLMTMGGPLVSWLLTGRFIFGLWVVFLVPLLGSPLIRCLKTWRTSELERSALSFLHGLRGLIRVGVSLPSALFQLSHSVPAPFASTLASFLAHFESGKSLTDCLSRFRSKSELKLTGVCLAMLEMAYQRGLSVSPLLDRMIPLLESDRQFREKESSLRRGAWVQMLLSVSIPWILGFAMHLFQPQILERFFHSSCFWPVLFLALGCQILGGVTLWKVSKFC